jgi:hypothetical protein
LYGNIVPASYGEAEHIELLTALDLILIITVILAWAVAAAAAISVISSSTGARIPA